MTSADNAEGENASSRSKRVPHAAAATHRFAVGQAVRLKSGFLPSGIDCVIVARLPPVGDSPQYRVRSEAEKFERMATQADLEPLAGTFA